jgi:hypothetical protein
MLILPSIRQRAHSSPHPLSNSVLPFSFFFAAESSRRTGPPLPTSAPYPPRNLIPIRPFSFFIFSSNSCVSDFLVLIFYSIFLFQCVQKFMYNFLLFETLFQNLCVSKFCFWILCLNFFLIVTKFLLYFFGFLCRFFIFSPIFVQ